MLKIRATFAGDDLDGFTEYPWQVFLNLQGLGPKSQHFYKMKLSKNLLFSVSILAVFSCQQNSSPPTPKGGAKQTQTADSLTYQISKIEKTLPCRGDSSQNCLTFYLEKLEITGGSSKEARRSIQQTLNEQLLGTDNAEIQPKSAADMAENFAKEYRQIQIEMPDYSLPWESRRSVKVIVNEQGLFEMEIKGSSFTGGAHGNSFTYFHLFDFDNGKLLEINDLIKPKALRTLTKSAEQKFRAQQNLKPDQSLDAAGFFFENDEFALPETFRYHENGLTFLYNPYEIAAYSMGEIKVEFSSEEIKDWVRAEYQLSHRTQ